MASPTLDKRSSRDILAAAEALAEIYTLDWKGAGDANDPGHAMLALFARLMELLIERLNRVPDKHFLEFLDLVGVEAFPGAPAEAPVTFLLSKKAELGGQVPAGTQMATTQTETADAHVFETRNAFFATPARLQAVVSLTPGHDLYAVVPVTDLPPSPEALAGGENAVTAFSDSGGTRVEHVFYLGSEGLFVRKDSVDLTLTVVTDGDTALFDEDNLQWKKYTDQDGWVNIDADYGDIPSHPVAAKFLAFSGAGAVEIGPNRTAVSLACHLLSLPDTTAATLPQIVSINGSIEPAAVPAAPPPDHAFANTTALDLSRTIFPFGERPKYGDAFYIGSAVAFAPDVAEVALTFTISPYSEVDLQTLFEKIAFTRRITTEIEWQYLAGNGVWKEIATYTHVLVVTPDVDGTPGTPATRPGVVLFGTDENRNGTLFGVDQADSATVSFNPANDANDITLAEVNGTESHWVRAIIRSRLTPYGQEASIETISPATSANPANLNFVGPTFIPPVIENISITYTPSSDPVAITDIVTLNNFEFKSESPQSFFPFSALATHRSSDVTTATFGSTPALYIGFDRPFGNAYISLFAHLEEAFDAASPQIESGDPRIVWEYLDRASAWKPLDVTDQSADLTASGVIAFTAPADSASAPLFLYHSGDKPIADGPLYWFRARLDGGRYDFLPRVRSILTNTVMADNQNTLRTDLIVGSASGEPNQLFNLVRAPILAGEVWVREPERPGVEELRQLQEDRQKQALEQGLPTARLLDDPVDERDLSEGERAIWVRWLRVPNFLSSTSGSRHYTLEAASGVLTFGGDSGRIPPIGKDNIVIREFLGGGGEAANRAATALAVKELKSSLPFVDKVFNVQKAVGGADPWSLDDIQRLGPQLIKNKARAVTTEDYVWLILSTFSQVVRVRCLPTVRPGDDGSLLFSPGSVVLIIVPGSTERTPQPSKGLLKKIRDFLRQKTFGTIIDDIHALPPTYQPVAVTARIKPLAADQSSLVARRAVTALEDFFHPLTGGEDGTGWRFGRDVYRSEVFAVLERTEGIDYVASADLNDNPDLDRIGIDDNALVASGVHRIEVI